MLALPRRTSVCSLGRATEHTGALACLHVCCMVGSSVAPGSCRVDVIVVLICAKVNDLMRVLERPYEEQPGAEKYRATAPKEVRMGVELLSCSS